MYPWAVNPSNDATDSVQAKLPKINNLMAVFIDRCCVSHAGFKRTGSYWLLMSRECCDLFAL